VFPSSRTTQVVEAMNCFISPAAGNGACAERRQKDVTSRTENDNFFIYKPWFDGK